MGMECSKTGIGLWLGIGIKGLPFSGLHNGTIGESWSWRKRDSLPGCRILSLTVGKSV